MTKKNISDAERVRRLEQSEIDKRFARESVPSGCSAPSVGRDVRLGDLLEQAYNPELLSQKGRVLGVPDAASANDETHTFTSVTDLTFAPDAEGNFGVIITPSPENHILTTGVDLANSVGVDMAAARHFVPKAQRGAVSVRKAGHYFDSVHGYFVIDDATNSVSPSPSSTLPLAIRGDGITVAGFHRGSDPLFYMKILGTPLASSGISLQGLVRVSRQALLAGQYHFELWGATDTGFTTGLTRVLDVTNAANSSEISINSTVNLSSYSSIVLAFTKNTSSVENACLDTVDISFTDLGTVSVSTTAVGQLFNFAANGVANSDFHDARLVSASALVQDRSATLYRGGNIAGDMMSGALTTSALETDLSRLSYSAISERVGSYVGDLAEGSYGRWMPRTSASWRAWKSTSGSDIGHDDNVLAFAGIAAFPAQAIIKIRVFSVWQVTTESRQYNPQRRSFLPQGMTDDEVDAVLWRGSQLAPIVTCNPTHEQWTRWMKLAGKYAVTAIKNAPAALALGAKLAAVLAAAV